MEYEVVIGLEVHAEILTKTKLFCGCKNNFGAEPNSLVCPVCLGLPGVLPVVNEEAIKKHIRAALALGCKISRYSKFDRKNYFYPDMPKDYQISQYDMPLAYDGSLEIEDDKGNKKTIGITRIHMEEDTGKSIHAGEAKSIASSDYTLLNYNRAGVPLLEIVSEPDISTPDEAYRYLVQLKKILTWLNVSDCKMEEGSLRCDANISLRKFGAEKLGTKTEIKNLNSFKGVRASLEFEIKRQEKILKSSGKIIQETRGWEDNKGITISMRSKEEAHDYRYFPEPDLPPLKLEEKWISDIKKELPEMPDAKAERFVNQFGIPKYDANILTSSKEFSEIFEESTNKCKDPKQVSNWIMGDISKYLNNNQIKIEDTFITAKNLSEMINLINNGTISGKIGKKLIIELLKKGGNPQEIIKKKGWEQITSKEELLPKIIEVIENNPDVLKNYINGKKSSKEFFVGQIMRATRGKASPKAVSELLEEELNRRS